MTEINNIYKKIGKIQVEIKGIKRTAENKFQGYKYFTEDKALLLLKPLLKKEGLAMTFSDSPEQFSQERVGEEKKSEWVLRYLKIVNISDGETTLTFNFWTAGQDADIAKAKGKAETYGMKYFLSKFWQIPVVDTLDPDQEKKEQERPLTQEEKGQINEFLKKNNFQFKK